MSCDATLAALLGTLSLTQYAETFATNEVDMAAAKLLSEAELGSLGLTLGARKKLYAALHNDAAAAGPAGTTAAAPSAAAATTLTPEQEARAQACWPRLSTPQKQQLIAAFENTRTAATELAKMLGVPAVAVTLDANHLLAAPAGAALEAWKAKGKSAAELAALQRMDANDWASSGIVEADSNALGWLAHRCTDAAHAEYGGLYDGGTPLPIWGLFFYTLNRAIAGNALHREAAAAAFGGRVHIAWDAPESTRFSRVRHDGNTVEFVINVRTAGGIPNTIPALDAVLPMLVDLGKAQKPAKEYSAVGSDYP